MGLMDSIDKGAASASVAVAMGTATPALAAGGALLAVASAFGRIGELALDPGNNKKALNALIPAPGGREAWLDAHQNELLKNA